MHVINLKMRAEAESLKPRITNAENNAENEHWNSKTSRISQGVCDFLN